MKGKKMVFAVMLSLIVCLLLVPTCAYATEVEPVPENSDVVVLPTVPDGDEPKVPAAPAVIGNLDDDVTADAPNGGDDGDDELNPDIDEDEGGEDSTIPGKDDDTEKEPGSDEEGEITIPGDSDDDDEDEDENENNANKDKPANNGGGSDNHTPSDNAPSNNGGNTGDNTNKGFQVELTYNDKVVKKDGLKGGESFDLAELLRELGIDGELTEAKGNADDLFDAVKGEDGWKFNTKMAFGDPYELVVTVGGVQYVIAVTDEGNIVNTDDYKSLQDAINNASNGQTVMLNSDFSEAITIAPGKTIIIDLNGHKLNGGSGHTIHNKGNLTINGDGEVHVHSGNRYATVLNEGTLTINGGYYDNTDWYLVKNLGEMTINDGTFHGRNANAMIVNGWYSQNNGNGYENDLGIKHTEGQVAKLTINGGSFDDLIKNDYYSELEINTGANVSGGVSNNSVATINGGTFTRKTYVITQTGTGSTTTINGGTFNTDAGNLLNPKESVTLKGSLVLNGGTYNVKVNKGKDLNVNVNQGFYSDKSIIDLTNENTVVVKSGNMYAVNESGYELAKTGETVEIVKAPAGQIDGVPAGVKVVNNSGNTIIINGKEIANGESYFEPVPATPVVTSDVSAFKYIVVEGKDQTWTKSANNETLNYVLNADANNLIKVLIDGEEVEFEIDENGEVVISAEVLEKLEAGDYVIEFIFADGSCKTKLFVK